MKILHIPNFYPPYIGGVGEICYYLVNCLAEENNIQQRVVCFHDKNESVHEMVHGVEVIRAKSFAKFKSQQISTNLFFLMRKEFQKFQPDIVHFHMPNPLASLYLLLLLPKSTRLIVHWHSDIINQKLMYLVVRGLEHKVLNRADIILVTSPLYAPCSKPLQPFLYKVGVLPNIISKEKIVINDENLNAAEEIKSKYGNKPIIFTIGRHVSYKGLEYLIKAEPLVKSDCVVLIGGSGPLTSLLKKMSVGRSRIHFLGFLPDQQMIQYMLAADIFAFPSITKNEAFGIALAEAMYCGAVPITFTIEGSGVNYVCIDKETGLEVSNKHYEGFAKAVDALLTDKNKYKRLQENGIKRVKENFTLDAIKEQLMKFYIDIL